MANPQEYVDEVLVRFVVRRSRFAFQLDSARIVQDAIEEGLPRSASSMDIMDTPEIVYVGPAESMMFSQLMAVPIPLPRRH